MRVVARGGIEPPTQGFSDSPKPLIYLKNHSDQFTTDLVFDRTAQPLEPCGTVCNRFLPHSLIRQAKAVRVHLPVPDRSALCAISAALSLALLEPAIVWLGH